MTKKLILLMLLIPLIVMISLFAATKTISIMVDVPVSGITVLNTDEHIYLDLDKSETLTLSYTVSPSNAKNKAVSASAEEIKGKNLAKLDFEYSDGSVKITPKSVGSAKVFLTTDDGGYRASVNVHVTSEKEYELKSMESYVERTELDIGESVLITHKFNPENPTNSNVTYSSDNKFVADVNEKGMIYAIRTGTANITARSESNPEIYNVLTITVYNSAVDDGGDDNDGGGATEEKKDYDYPTPPTFSTVTNEGKIGFDLPSGVKNLTLSKFTARAYASDGSDISDKIELAVIKEDGGEYYAVTYKFKDEKFNGKYKLEIKYNDGSSEFSITYNELEKVTEDKITLGITFDEGNEKLVFVNAANLRIPFTVTPSGAECNVTVSVANTGIVSNAKISNSQQFITYNSVSAGVTTMTVKASLKSDPKLFAEATVTVYVSPRSENFNVSIPSANISNDRIQDVFTLGKYEYVYKYDASGNVEANKTASSNTTVTTTHTSANKVAFGVSVGGQAPDSSFYSGIRWEVAPEYASCVYVDENGVICFRDNTDTFDEIVEFRAVFGKGASEVYTTYDIRCVAGGINVYSYLDLYRATYLDEANGNSRSVVLRSNITDTFGYYVNANGEKVPHYTEIHTTYDDDYYKATGNLDQAKIKILVEFKNNVYGNGFTINAHNLTIGLLDDTGSWSDETIFRGPLNFVAMSETNSNSAVSFKGQDNVCFAVYEGVTLNNVNLIGASPDESKELDLIDLNYAGTVVEALGDNITIEYSRIRYGRTVLRAFGDVNDPNKAIHVNIKNSRLSEAREFIIRTGSNRFVEGSYDDPAPKLDGAADDTHNTKTKYNTALTDAERAEYDSKFINTFIEIENSVFRNTGLFAIGIDSHFGSYALADGSKFTQLFEGMGIFTKSDGTSFLKSWKDLSKTSYGAKVKFVGNVGLYTWKPIEDVNSDTIIEMPSKSMLENIEVLAKTIPDVKKFLDLLNKLDFNVQKMISKYNDKLSKDNDPDNDIVYSESEGNYIHGGIVLFGGGKNYGVFDSTEAGLSLNAYDIDLAEVGVDYLKHAAGGEKFYFLMFSKGDYKTNSNSKTDDLIFKKSN